MKLLYFTTASDPKQYEAIQKQSKVKASVASQVYESALLKGMAGVDDLELCLYSFPMIAAFPGSKLLCWGARKQKTASGQPTTWLRTVNLFGLKQFSQRLSARRAVRKWLKENQDTSEKAILLYSVYEPIAKPVLKAAKKSNCKAFAIIPDLPRDMYKTLSRNPLMAAMQKRYMKRAVACQDQFDGYIYLTKAMREAVAPDKPYCIVEGIADTDFVVEPVLKEKTKKHGVMYAGALREDYGLKNLIEGFLSLDLPDAELWFFGAGNYASEIEKASKEHETIRYLGQVSREDVLRCERAASVLANVRDPKDEFTKYSFPSKTIEYMLSGTPLLTTALQGIPDEYHPYLYMIENNAPQTVCSALRELLKQTPEELIEHGTKAQQFIVNEKNALKQAEKLTAFIRESVHE